MRTNKEEFRWCLDEIATLRARLTATEAALAEAKEALTFYRDEWFNDAEDDPSTGGRIFPLEPTERLENDRGETARAALARIEALEAGNE